MLHLLKLLLLLRQHQQRYEDSAMKASEIEQSRPQPRNQRLVLSITKDQKRKLRKAAKLYGRKMSDMVQGDVDRCIAALEDGVVPLGKVKA